MSARRVCACECRDLTGCNKSHEPRAVHSREQCDFYRSEHDARPYRYVLADGTPGVYRWEVGYK